MKVVYFDMFSGISGDMTLGALIDLGTPVKFLQKELNKVLSGFQLKADVVLKSHLRATDLVVEVDGDEGVSRNYTDIKGMIEKSSLSDSVKIKSLEAFKKIAEAEAHIHNKEIEKVHFHEIGGIDSIVDIIGSFLALEYLGVDKIFGSVVPLGSGFVDCAHGRIPVPVPATLAILKNIPVVSSDAKTEIVTPTGAALISTMAESFGSMPEMSVEKIGYGSGKRDTGSGLPNLLRVVIGESVANDNAESVIKKEIIHEVKTNVDDMNPECLGFLMEKLFNKKALDVIFKPVQMKKNRPGTQIEVICRKEDLEDIVKEILSSTSSIGVRSYECERFYLVREKIDIDTAFGKLQVKKVIRPSKEGSKIEYVPEYDVAARIAEEKQLVLQDVYSQIISDANSLDMK